MAAGSTLKTVSVAVGAALGGSGLVILIGVLLIGVLVLSLIPIYTPNNSVQPYGEIYRISGLAIKAIYTNLTNTNFTGATVVDTSQLSYICSAIMRSKGDPNFYGCIAKNFLAYGPTNFTDPGSRRRRGAYDVSLYEIGDIWLLYKNTCSNKRALGQWFSALTYSQNSSCVAQRVTACKSFITYPNNGLGGNEWLPFPDGYTQALRNSSNGCSAISISRIFNVPTSAYVGVALRTNATFSYNIVGDCQLYAILSQADLQANVASLLSTSINVNTSCIT